MSVNTKHSHRNPSDNWEEKQGERGRAGEEHCEDRGKLLYLVIQVTGVE